MDEVISYLSVVDYKVILDTSQVDLALAVLLEVSATEDVVDCLLAVLDKVTVLSANVHLPHLASAVAQLLIQASSQRVLY